MLKYCKVRWLKKRQMLCIVDHLCSLAKGIHNVGMENLKCVDILISTMFGKRQMLCIVDHLCSLAKVLLSTMVGKRQMLCVVD